MTKQTATRSALNRFASLDSLPESFVEDAETFYWPLTRTLAEKIKTGDIAVIGVSGSQGSGKSTLAKLLRCIFEEVDGLRAIDLSIDDFYLTRQERQQLGETVHPLLASRGVPGTHDVTLAKSTISQLLDSTNTSAKIPRFDKAVDDRKPESEWETVSTPVDVVILEGWCISIPPQDANELSPAINELESKEDPDLSWRNYVNDSLTRDYLSLYAMIDYCIFLESPSFSTVYEWRLLQEEKLKAATSASKKNQKIMSPKDIERFIQHFERLTNHGYKTLPEIVDVIFKLNKDHRISQRIDKAHVENQE